MTNSPCLPTQNPEWGFFGTYIRNFAADGATATAAWTDFSDALATYTDLSDAEIRDYLDDRAGRHWADDLSFIRGAHDRAAIFAHVEARLALPAWRRSIPRTALAA